jgi:hypothetical protein
MTTTATPEVEVDLLAGLRSGSWLDAQEFPPLAWVVPGLLPEGFSLLVGGPKIGKSWLSLDVALAVASGGCALGRLGVERRPVLLLALEDGDRRLQDRARELLAGDPIPADLHYMTRIVPGSVVTTIETWLERLPDGCPEPLVILDTLGKVMPLAAPGESAYQRDYRVAGRLKQLCDSRPGMALLVLHHDRKATTEDFVDGVSGTNGIAGAADTVLVITRPRTEEHGLFKVTGRDVVEAEYAVTVSGGRWRLGGADLDTAALAAQTARVTANLADRSAEIVRYVAHHVDGVRAADVAEHLDDLNPKDAAQYLTRLHAAGKLNRPERGLYTPVVSVVSVVTQDSLTYDTNDTYDTGSRGPDA